jgi:hypothetical protein
MNKNFRNGCCSCASTTNCSRPHVSAGMYENVLVCGYDDALNSHHDYVDADRRASPQNCSTERECEPVHRDHRRYDGRDNGAVLLIDSAASKGSKVVK